MTEAWERLPNERPKPFQAFVVYRDMGLERSLAKVSTTLGKSVQLMERWSKKYNWVARVKAYDASIDQKSLKVAEDAREEMVRRQVAQAKGWQGLSIDKLEKMRNEKMGKDLSTAQAIKIFEVATKVERDLLLGDSATPKVDITVKTEVPKPEEEEIDADRIAAVLNVLAGVGLIPRPDGTKTTQGQHKAEEE